MSIFENNKSTPSTDYFSIVKIHLLSGIPLMQKNKAYTLKQICHLTPEGRKYWTLEPSPEMVGTEVAVAVRNRLIPLTISGKNSRNSIIYQSI